MILVVNREDIEEINRLILKCLLLTTTQKEVGLVQVTEGDEGTRPSLDIQQIEGERYAWIVWTINR